MKKTRYFVDNVDSLGTIGVWKEIEGSIEYFHENQAWEKSTYKTLKRLKESNREIKEVSAEELALLF